MTIEQDILKKLIEIGELEDQSDKLRGIAQAGADKGTENLSPLQLDVIQPVLEASCSGVTDPGGYHNNCQAELSGREYLDALEHKAYYDATLCVDCREETDRYAAEWSRIQAE